MFPLAMVMSEHDAKMHQERDSDDSYVVTQACEKTVTIPVEPAVSHHLESNILCNAK